MSVPKVFLSHAGVQYSYPLAFGLQKLGMLEAFATPIYLSAQIPSVPVLKRFLSRRHFSGLDSRKILSLAGCEMLQRALSLPLPKSHYWRNPLLYFTNRFFDLRVARRLERHSFDFFMGLSGGSLESFQKAKRLGKIVLCDQHDIHYSLAARLIREEREAHPEFASSMPYWPPYQPYLDLLEKEFQIADFIFVPSLFSLRSHLQAGIPQEKLILMPHGVQVPADEPSFTRPSGKFRLLFAGTLTQRKGIKYLFEAVRQLRHPNLELIVVGDNMSSRAALRPYEDYFSYHPYLPHTELKRLFQEVHALVLPSLYDAFGLVALDAMAAGLPVVVSEHTAAGSDVVRDGVDGFVVPIRDAEALKDRILFLEKDRKRAESMGRNARQRVRIYSSETYQEKLADRIFSIWKNKTGELLHA